MTSFSIFPNVTITALNICNYQPTVRAEYDSRSTYFNRFEFSFSSPRLVLIPRLKKPVCSTIYQ